MVICLAQDQEGRIWMGTQDGAYSFDGRSWHHYAEKAGLPSANILQLLRASDGTLWARTSSGLAFWSDGKFHNANTLGLPDTLVNAITHHRLGVFVITAGRLFQAAHGGRFQAIGTLPLSGNVTSAWNSQDGSLIYLATAISSTERYLVRWQNGQWTSRILPKNTTDVNGILEDSKGRIWLHTSGPMLMASGFDAPWQDFGHAVHGTPVPTQIATMHEDSSGRIWTTDGQQLLFLDENLRPDALGRSQGLDLTPVNAFMFDQEGSLWIAGNGLRRLLGNFQIINHTKQEGLPDSMVWAICGNERNQIMVGTGNGIALLDDRRWINFPETSSRPFKAVIRDRQGRWLAGSCAHLNGHSPLFILERGAKRFRQVSLPWNDPKLAVSSMAEDAKGRVWIAAYHFGVVLLTPTGKGYRAEKVPPPPGYSSWERVNGIRIDAQQNVWVYGAILGRWDGTRWWVLDTRKGLKGTVAGVFIESPESAIIYYIDFPGIQRFKVTASGLQPKAFQTHPEAIFQHTIYLVEEAPNNTLLVGTIRGLFKWKGKQFEPLGATEGLIAEDISENALWIHPNGDIWVGSSGGAIRIRDKQFAKPSLPMPFVDLAQDAVGHTIKADEKIHYEHRHLRFRVGLTAFSQEGRLTLEARMKGLEDDWHPIEGAEIRYPFLPPGHYTLELRALDALGNAGPIKKFPLEIQSPWWTSLWAFFLYILTGLGLLKLVVLWRTHQLNLQAKVLENRVSERTEALAKAMGELAELNGQLQEATMIDPLTGLHNRRFLSMTMPGEEARIRRAFHVVPSDTDELRPQGLPFQEDSVIYIIDLDFFKRINDTHGHAAGDAVLKETAIRLKSVSRESDAVLRWGGEEFIVIAKRTHRSAATIIAENIRRAIAEKAFVMPGGNLVQITCSVGFAPLPSLTAIPELLPWEYVVDMADQCLYVAKHSGRNAWVGCNLEQNLDREQAERLLPLLRTQLHQAVTSGEVHIHSSVALDKLDWNRG